MTSERLPPAPIFGDFYRAVHDRDPFPWQERLAERVVADGWPAEIAVPTGLGKTACIDIAVWALAAQAHRRDRRLPTRIWYVVNRRLLVDHAYDLGERLALRLDAALRGADDSAAIRAVAKRLDALAAFGSEHGPLHVTRLRGGALPASRLVSGRVPDPSQPALVFSTVPMFASRWLFRGYGSSRSMRPIDAALAGIDTLVLLDEAHLARPLLRLAGADGPIAQCDIGDPGTLLPAERSRPWLVSLTATGERSDHAFDLDAADLRHPVVRQRINAQKEMRLREGTKGKAATELADAALELLAAREQPAACVVFTNTPGRAREVHAALVPRLGALDGDAEVLLLTGRVREWDAERLREEVLDPERGAPAGRPAERARPLVVVATQTLEVGADLDFDFLVTEAAGVRALVQRLGRLNRLGERPWARAIVYRAPGDDVQVSIYGAEIDAVWERLVEAIGFDESADAGPAKITEVLGEPADPVPRTGELLPHHLWEWAKTSCPPAGEAPVELFFDAWDERNATVTVLWRAHVAPGEPLHAPVRAAETVEVPIWEARSLLNDRGIEQVLVLDPDRAATIERATNELRPGDEIVLPCDVGGHDDFGWHPTATGEVLDATPFLTGDLVVHPAVVRNLLDPGPEQDLAIGIVEQLRKQEGDWDDVDPFEEQALARELIALLRAAAVREVVPLDRWQALLDGLTGEIARPSDRDPVLVGQQPVVVRRAIVRVDAFDELSFTATSAQLAEHLGGVGEAAGLIAARLGLPPDLVEAVRRAGCYHDLGKADERFQRWLDPVRRSGTMLAKSAMPLHRREAARRASGWPRGGRHEALSARLVAAARDSGDSLSDLVLHLVLAHHGYARPLVPAVVDDAAASVRAEIDGEPVEVSADLSIVDWEQPRRFRTLCEQYGYWGLALLEAVVRQADQAVSSVVGVEVV